MPRGSHHDETGWLNEDNRRLMLRRDAGGRWQLDAPANVWKFVGRRVRVTGVRAEFDLLEVTSIEAL